MIETGERVIVDLHRQRPEVLGVQGGLSPRAARRRRCPGTPTCRWSCRPTSTRCGAPSTPAWPPWRDALSDDPEDGPSTRAVHGGEPRPKGDFSITPPLVLSSTFTFAKTADLVAYMEGRATRGEEYGRYGNPTRQAAEAKLAALEGAEAACLFASGMAAVTTTLLAMLRSEAHVVFTNDCYRKTRQFAESVLKKVGRGLRPGAPAGGSHRGRAAAEHPAHLHREPDQPLPERRRPREARGPGPLTADQDRHRLHLRHALQPAAAGVRGRPRRAFGHQVPGRPQRPPGRRDPRRP